MLSPTVFDFLNDLQANNHKEWMDAHRDRYEAAREQVLHLIEEILVELAEFEPLARSLTAREAILRINRDIRFSRNKAPYKNYFGAIFSKGGGHRSSFPDYYLHLSPGACFVAGGCYSPDREALKRLRAQIDAQAPRLRAILDAPDLKAYFGELEGESLKTSPRDYPKDHPDLDLLNHLSVAVSRPLSDALVHSERLVTEVIHAFRLVQPLVEFLNEALTDEG
jgi:uncharacterized protein (TIGR02453 family)